MRHIVRVVPLLALVLIAVLSMAGQNVPGTFTSIQSSLEPLPGCAVAVQGQPQPFIYDITASLLKTCTAPNVWSSITTAISTTATYVTVDATGSPPANFQALTAGSNITLSPNAGAHTLTIAATTPAVTLIAPQGRLTLTSGTPVMTADATAQSTVFYDAYAGWLIPIFNGTAWNQFTITGNEVSMGLDATVPHIASGSLYDIFGVNNSGSLAICTGPAWSSTTARGTGAGTTQIHRQSASGLWTNQNALTHCWGGASGLTDFGSVSTDQATYLGTLDATANGQTGMQFKPAAAAGGTNNILGLFNAYNQVSVTSLSRDSTASWTYASTTWRAADASNSNRVTYVDGLQQSPVAATYLVGEQSNSASSAAAVTGVSLDSTTSAPGDSGVAVGTNSTTTTSSSVENFSPVLGLHFVQAMEATVSGTSLFLGSASTPTRQLQALVIQVPM